MNATRLIRNSVVDIPRGDENCSGFEQMEIRKCAEPLYASGILQPTSNNFELSWNYFFGKTRDFFVSVCESFLEFDLCIEPYKDSCFAQKPARTRYQAAVGILNFICGNGHDEIAESFNCFSRTMARPEMLQCQAEVASDTQKLPPFNGNNSAAYEMALCGAIRNYIDCIKYPIRYECGYRAWYTLCEIIVRPTTVLLPECNIVGVRGMRSSWSSLYDILAGVVSAFSEKWWS
uniref:DUF19 domain-containing protein n=1 Tax=Syphacia muris TaxID=451379 RepID=A0A0N5AVW8_9BILA